MEIRVANKADYAAFTRLELEVHALHVANEPWLFQMPVEGVLWEREAFEAMIDSLEATLFLAEDEADPVGFAFAVLRSQQPRSMFAPRRFCTIDSIGVTAACQGRGVGQALMAAVRAWALANGVHQLELSVHTFNRQAVRFYERLGFRAYTQRMCLALTPEDRPGE